MIEFRDYSGVEPLPFTLGIVGILLLLAGGLVLARRVAGGERLHLWSRRWWQVGTVLTGSVLLAFLVAVLIRPA